MCLQDNGKFFIRHLSELIDFVIVGITFHQGLLYMEYNVSFGDNVETQIPEHSLSHSG
jgi:hypothetical protein